MFGMQKKLQFSIRKLALGAASVVIGAFLFGSSTASVPTLAQEPSLGAKQTAMIHYLSISEKELTASEKALVENRPLSQMEVRENDSYILVYKTKANQLVNTGDKGGMLPFLMGGGLLLLVVSFGKNKKQRVLGAVLVSLASVGTAQIVAENDLLPLAYKEVSVQVGATLAEQSLEGYDFIGLIPDEKLEPGSRLYRLLERYRTSGQNSEKTSEKQNATTGERRGSSESETNGRSTTETLPTSPEVEHPVIPLPTDEPAPVTPPVDAVPPSAPEVELPVSPLPTDEPAPVTPPVDAVPPSAPEVELPVSPLPTDEPAPVTPPVDAVPPSAPEVELPVSPLPTDEPAPATPPVDAVPPSAPEVELPVSPLPTDEPAPATPPVDAVPPSAPEVELPVSPLPTDEPAPATPPVDAVPPSAPEVDLPVSPLPTEDVSNPGSNAEEEAQPVVPTNPDTDPVSKPEEGVDKTPLETAITELETDLSTPVELVGYTEDSIQVYQHVKSLVQANLDFARQRLVAPDLTQIEINSLAQDLTQLQAELGAKKLDLTVDMTNLDAALVQLGHEIETDIDRVNSRPSSVSKYDTQKAIASSVFSRGHRLLQKTSVATVAEVAAMTEEVLSAIQTIKIAKKSVEPILDKSDLTALATELESAIATTVDVEEMESTSVNAYKQALEAAKQALNKVKFGIQNKDLSLEENNKRLQIGREALTKLQQAQGEIKPDKTALRTNIERLAKELEIDVTLTDKTADSRQAYEVAHRAAQLLKEQATALVGKALASKQEIKETVQAISRAMMNLEQARTALESEEQAVLSERKLDFKNVDSAFLYKLTDGKQLVKLLSLSEADTDTSNYQLKVQLSDGKSIWMNVETINDNGDHFKVIGRLPELVSFAANQEVTNGYTITVAKRSTNQSSHYTSFKSLIEAIRQNPTGEFIIGADLTASEVKSEWKEQSYLDGVTFMGKLRSADGQTYTIHDMERALFKNLYMATISNIHFENVAIAASNVEELGTLANHVDNSVITNVSATGSVMGNKNVGGLIGVLDNASQLTNASFEGKVSSSHSAGGLVGTVSRGSKVSNAYTNVSMSSFLQPSEPMGGLVGQLNHNSSVENAYVKGEIVNSGQNNAYAGGAIGSVYGETTTNGTILDKGKVENVISFAKVVNGNDFIGNLKSVLISKEKHLNNNHIVRNVSVGNHVEDSSLTSISQEEAERQSSSFYKKPQTNSHFYTNASRVDYTKVHGYKASHEKAYRNMEKLIPFYDRVTIVREANKLAENDSFVTKEISSVQAYMGDKLATNIYNNRAAVSKILVRYTDDSKDELVVASPTEFKHTGILDYTITEKGINYHPYQLLKDYSELSRRITATIADKVYDENLFNPYNLMDWEAKDRGPKIERLYLRDNFQKIKTEFEKTLIGLLENHAVADYTTGIQKELLEKYLQDNAKNLLVGLNYLDRWYDFSNVRDSLLFALNTYGSDASSLDLVSRLGGETIEVLRSDATQLAYLQVLSNYTNQQTLADFIQKNYRLFKADEQDIDSWMKSTSKAYITTRDSKVLTDKKTLIFDRLSDHRLQNMLLPLLTIKEEHVYAIFASNGSYFGIYDRYMDGVSKGHANYEAKLQEVRGKVNSTAESIQRYFDALYRLLNERSKERLLKTSILTFDGLSNTELYGIPNRYDRSYTWSKEYGDGAFASVKAFIGPIRHWMALSNYASAYAMVGNGSEIVHYSKGSLLSSPGLATLTHEHTHNLDNHVILDGYYKRTGHGAESFAMGLFESPHVGSDTLGVNLIYDAGTGSNNALAHNSNPERFENIDSLHKYMRGVFDVLYTLEAAEGEALIKKGTGYIADRYHKIYAEEASYNRPNNEDVVSNIYNFYNTRITSINDLVDHGIVGGGIHQGNYGLDDYIKVNMFEAQFGIMENTKGASGGITFRRVAYELLAEKGYYEGMIPYISAKYVLEGVAENEIPQSDSYILKKVFDGKYDSFKAFRKDMLKRRKDAGSDLKEVSFLGAGVNTETVRTFDDIVRLMTQAMSSTNRNAVYNLKRAIFNAYLQKTNEFRDSIYKNPKP